MFLNNHASIKECGKSEIEVLFKQDRPEELPPELHISESHPVSGDAVAQNTPDGTYPAQSVGTGGKAVGTVYIRQNVMVNSSVRMVKMFLFSQIPGR